MPADTWQKSLSQNYNKNKYPVLTLSMTFNFEIEGKLAIAT